MSTSGLLLLDTSVVLHVARGRATGDALDRAFGLRARLDRPLISIITVGELLSFAKQRGWGSVKLERLEALVRELIVVDVRSRSIVDRYAEIDTFMVKHGHLVGDNDA